MHRAGTGFRRGVYYSNRRKAEYVRSGVDEMLGVCGASCLAASTLQANRKLMSRRMVLNLSCSIARGTFKTADAWALLPEIQV